MRIFAYNDKLNEKGEFGSFTVVARKLNEQFAKAGILGNIYDPETYVIFPECLNTQQKFKRHIPLLACEYSKAPRIVTHWLNEYKPKVIAISEFARQNIVSSGYDYEKTYTAHLGADETVWYNTKEEKFPEFTFLTVNSSNERSGFEELIPAFRKFAKDKPVRLIIKDGPNPRFETYLRYLNDDGKIVYIGKIMSEAELRSLYNKSHLFIYANNTTSFGMTPCDAVLCGTPAIVTLGSALKEFVPEWTQPAKIKTEIKPYDSQSLERWEQLGLNPFPPSMFPEQVYGERVIRQDILNALEYSFKNYKEYLDILPKHQDFIRKNLTWKQTSDRIVEIIKS